MGELLPGPGRQALFHNGALVERHDTAAAAWNPVHNAATRLEPDDHFDRRVHDHGWRRARRGGGVVSVLRS